ncbi:MAG: DUF6132 family protein [Candidatus Marinimicrobia bacterium]|jgi:hypothetical protein|nr:DUF6132 family protein [Candidatus Neomarinimicrobiota bacterium]
MKKYFSLRHIIFIVVGGIIGFVYYHFWGCANQTCPITSNPYLTILYGMAFGYILTPGKKKSKDKSEK